MRWRTLSRLLLAGFLLVLAACVPGGSEGERLYRRHCATCHAVDGRGGLQYLADEGADLLDDAWTYGSDPGSLERTLREGLVFDHPEWKLSNQEIRQLVDHLLVLRGETR